MSTSRRKPPRAPLSARELAMDALTRVEQDKSYSNLLLNQLLQQHKLSRPDAALATELFYGTIQRLNTIDHFLSGFAAKGLDALQPWVRSLLRLSFYQLYYLERIPPHAAVSEAVNIAKRRGHQGIAGLVNGVLRNVLRQKDRLVIPDDWEPAKRISLRHSHPEWLVRRWLGRFGEEMTERMCAANNEPPHASIRTNTLRVTRDELLAELQRAGFDAEGSPLAPPGIIAVKSGNMAHAPGFAEGLFSIQDESSMLVALAVDPQPGMTVLDCCAAPGGKTAHMAELMRDEGRIVACDLHEHKERLVSEQARRLGLASIETVVADAATLPGRFADGTFDRILLDAPCSGLGVIRRKPDLKWSKREADIAAMRDIQAQLLSAVHRLLKPGGIFVYSTCTLESSENEEQIERFIRENPAFELVAFPEHADTPAFRGTADGMVRILPHEYGTDGFFIARLRRKKQ